MKPRIIKTRFGGISFQDDGEKVDYSHDTLIRLDGKVRERRKKLSKQIYGTSHTLSLAEAEYIYEEGAEMLLIGTGQFGLVELSDEAAGYFRAKAVEVQLQPTPKAIETWNELSGKVIGLFHVTC